jgi:hypothetical protein
MMLKWRDQAIQFIESTQIEPWSGEIGTIKGGWAELTNWIA